MTPRAIPGLVILVPLGFGFLWVSMAPHAFRADDPIDDHLPPNERPPEMRFVGWFPPDLHELHRRFYPASALRDRVRRLTITFFVLLVLGGLAMFFLLPDLHGHRG